MKKGLLAIILTLALTAFIGCTTEEETAMDEMAEEMMAEHAETEMPSEKMEAEAPADLEVAAYGTLADYSADTLAELKGSAPVALFFHAEWCATCLGIEADLEENVSNLPKGTTILTADYDKETELKKEYGVTMQSTLVFLDSDGNAVETLQGASTFAQIKTALIASTQ